MPLSAIRWLMRASSEPEAFHRGVGQEPLAGGSYPTLITDPHVRRRQCLAVRISDLNLERASAA